MTEISLICLDFDGTIMVYDETPGFFHPAAIEILNALAERGVCWCTNSGRDMEGQARILEASRARGLRHLPAALLCSESLIFERRNGGYAPSEPWNSSALDLQGRLHEQVQAVIRPRLPDWGARFQPDQYIGAGYTVFNVVDAEDRPLRLAGEVEAALRGVRDVMVTRNGGWVAVLPTQLGKGNVLRGYLDRAGIAHHRALAVGDHFNDLNMLDGSVTPHVGCPGSAVGDVVRAVSEAGGYVARAEGPEGTVEVIRHYLGL
jgi:hydroxymethylpyrimidine pyrophosphatase-like HAD family hydrolase